MTATVERPLLTRAINVVGRSAGRVGWRPSLDEHALLEAARRATGLDDFGPDSFREGLAVLLASLEEEAQLTTIGRLAARTRVLTALEIRLRLQDHRRRHPEVAEQRITRPIFVLGLPRTGTTLLYGLLASDPAMRAPASWEVARPFPPPTADSDADPRIRATEREFDQFRRIAPSVDRIHPLGATLPQECLALQAPEFASYEYPTLFPIPSYWRWLRGQDLASAYAFQLRFLQHLQSGHGGAHWILKTPAHLMWLDTLLDTFPDALIVQTHRDPATVMASVSSLMFTLRRAVSDAVDPLEVGREQLDAWRWGLERTMRARERLDPGRVVDVRFEDTMTDPVGTVRRIYDHLGLDTTPAVDEGVRRYLAANPRTKHGVHRYGLADFGLDRDRCREAFAGYRDRFDVAEEPS